MQRERSAASTAATISPTTSTTVAVVTYNSRQDVERCLAAIFSQLPSGGEVLVVDNNSSDGTAALVRDRFPRARLIVNARNTGFGSANNQAIRASSGEYVVLVNPDCELAPGALAGLTRFMARHPRAAVAGGRLRFADGSFQHSAFRFPSLAQVFLDFFPLHQRLAESRWNGRYPRAWDARAFPIDFPLGALMCVRRAAIDEVGLFDEGFFMYVEEVDWCYRFQRAGWEVWHCPDALAIHHGGHSTRQQAAAMFVELHRSRLRFYRKHYSAPFRVAARALLAAGALAQATTEWLADARAGGALPERRARARACLEVLRL
jgi:N-acetylglucosaminyl-diphospho-decaprenol L-rhamnosyltransferase